MREDSIWYWFTELFTSAPDKKGQEESKNWKSFINEDIKVSHETDSAVIEIEDIPNFPEDTAIKNIDGKAEITRKNKTVVTIGRRFIGDQIDKIRGAGYSLNEKEENIEIEFHGNGVEEQKPTGVECVDEFLSQVKAIHDSREYGSYSVTLNLPSGAVGSETITEGGLTKKTEITAVSCNTKKDIAGIQLTLSVKDYSEDKASRLYELFTSRNSSDKDKIYNLLFTAKTSKYNLPSYLKTIKDIYEAKIGQLMGDCVKKVSPYFERLAKVLASYETITGILSDPKNLHEEIEADKNKSKRWIKFIILLGLLTIGDMGLNYIIFDKVIGDENILILLSTVIFYGAVIVTAAEMYVWICSDCKDVFSFRSLLIVLPLILLLMGSGYIRYIFEATKDISGAAGPVSLENLSQPAAQNEQDFVRNIVIALFFTVLSLLVFIIAVIIGYWHKYGNLRIFFNKYSDFRHHKKIKKIRRNIKSEVEEYKNKWINPLIQSAQREIAEYISGFENGGSRLQTEAGDKSKFNSYLHWLKMTVNKNLKIESGSQINKDDYDKIENDLSNKMHHYLRIKNKAIAFTMGFNDAVNSRANNPEMISGNPLFHGEDSSIQIKLSECDIEECKRAYEFGYSYKAQ